MLMKEVPKFSRSLSRQSEQFGYTATKLGKSIAASELFGLIERLRLLPGLVHGDDSFLGIHNPNSRCSAAKILLHSLVHASHSIGRRQNLDDQPRDVGHKGAAEFVERNRAIEDHNVGPANGIRISFDNQ